MRITRWGAGLVALVASTGAWAEDAPDAAIDTGAPAPDAGVNSDALPGVFRVAGASDLRTGLALAVTAGYGFTEDVLQQSDQHHRLRGSVAASYRPAPVVALGVRLDGRYDRHSADMLDSDDGYTGEMRLFAHLNKSLSPTFAGGLQLVGWVPGVDGISAEVRGIASVAAGPATIHLNAGFRLDRSAETVDNADELSRADRLALGVSDSNAVLLGAGLSFPAGSIELLAEGGWDLLVGADAPPVIESPLRAAAGVRVPITDAYHLEAMLEGSFGRAPLVDVMQPLVPVEPLVGVSVSLSQRPSARVAIAEPIAEPIVKEDKEPPVVKPRLGGLRGTVRASDGSPIKGAVVRLGKSELLTDANGQFAIDQLDPGDYEVEASASGYGSVTERVSIENDRVLQINIILGQIEVAIVRGVIQSYSGDAVVATVRIEPGGKELISKPDGTFQVELESGTYKVSVSADGYKPKESELTVEAGGPVTILNIDLQKK